jgi:N-acetylglucosamine malate deacetylase 2
MGDRCLIVAPHPDDETIGAGIWMHRHRNCEITLLHITDGSPRDPADAKAVGFPNRRAYAAARRRELHAALSLVGVRHSQLRIFSYVDKETYQHLPELVARMTALIDQLRPTLVLSPAYEGGHPDHDSAALAVAAARTRVSSRFRHREYQLYHAGPDGAMLTGTFLNDSKTSVEVCQLTPAEQETKQAMMARFQSQQHILTRFQVLQESLRDAPAYDFSCPPHEGTLLYEYWKLGVTGAEWRLHAQAVTLPGSKRMGSRAGP